MVGLVFCASAFAQSTAHEVAKQTLKLNPTVAQTGVPASSQCETSGTTELVLRPVLDFCRRPHEAVCGASRVTNAEYRKKRIENFSQDARKAALDKLAAKFGLDRKALTEDTILKVWGPAEKNRYYKAFMSYVQAEVFARMTNVDVQAFHDTEHVVRGHLSSALLREYLSGALPKETYEKMSARIGSAKVLLPTELSSSSAFDDDEKDEIWAGFREHCGADGLANNAFVRSTSSRKNYVLICPGWIAGALGSGNNRDSAIMNLLAAMSHEVSHLIDANAIPEAYYKYTQCLAKSYASELYMSAHQADKEWPEYINSTNAIDNFGGAQNAKNYFKVREHQGEISADFWAAATIGQMFASTLPPFTKAEMVRILQEAYSGLCVHPNDDGTHPSWHFRIEGVLRHDTLIHKLLGCVPPAAPRFPTCDLNGEHPGIY